MASLLYSTVITRIRKVEKMLTTADKDLRAGKITSRAISEKLIFSQNTLPLSSIIIRKQSSADVADIRDRGGRESKVMR